LGTASDFDEDGLVLKITIDTVRPNQEKILPNINDWDSKVFVF
jgi:hypothetical protein